VFALGPSSAGHRLMGGRFVATAHRPAAYSSIKTHAAAAQSVRPSDAAAATLRKHEVQKNPDLGRSRLLEVHPDRRASLWRI
jgi:hypothetical protein